MCIFINLEEQCLVNGKTGGIKRLGCFTALAMYHSYMLSTKHPKAAQQLLDDAWKGKKVISDMIGQFHNK